MTTMDGESKPVHVLKAEQASGVPLFHSGHVVHHVDGCRSNNANSNLVICEDAEYRRLLHARQKMLQSGGRWVMRDRTRARRVLMHFRESDGTARMVICENTTYRSLLHSRRRIIQAGGVPGKDLVCCICGQARPKKTVRSSRCEACRKDLPDVVFGSGRGFEKRLQAYLAGE